MSKKIIAVNAGPRKGWNTDTLQLKSITTLILFDKGQEVKKRLGVVPKDEILSMF